jgi:hypothetical protein
MDLILIILIILLLFGGGFGYRRYGYGGGIGIGGLLLLILVLYLIFGRHGIWGDPHVRSIPPTRRRASQGEPTQWPPRGLASREGAAGLARQHGFYGKGAPASSAAMSAIASMPRWW